MVYKIVVEINADSEKQAVDMLIMALENQGIHFTKISSDNIVEKRIRK